MRTSELGKDPSRDRLLSRRVALLTAAGRTDKQICDDLEVSQGVLETMRKSPLHRELVATFGEELEQKQITSIAEEIANDAPRNLNFIKQVRDGEFTDPKDKMQLRMQAAKLLLDKQTPNADVKAQNEAAARLIIDGRVLGQVLRAMKNVGVIDVTDRDIESATGIPLLTAKTPEQFEESYAPPEASDE